MCKISTTCSLQHQVFLASCYQLSYKFSVMCAITVLENDKTTAQQLTSWLLDTTRVLVVQQQIFINKIQIWQMESNSQPCLIVPFTTYCIRNSLPYVSIRNALLDFL